MEVSFESLLGKTITSVDGGVGSDLLSFCCDDGSKFQMLHEQNCCEDVEVQDICGDLGDIIGSPILMAEEVTNDEEHPPDYKPEYEPESYTWTFYKLATIKGAVTIRWLGSSNGYYSESVDFVMVVSPS
jgi:hypothetical protein